MKLKSENVRKRTLRCDQAVVRVKVETDEIENKNIFTSVQSINIESPK